MDRQTFLTQARQTACQQIVDSSSLTEEDWLHIKSEIENEAMNEDEALIKKAREILEDAAMDIEE